MKNRSWTDRFGRKLAVILCPRADLEQENYHDMVALHGFSNIRWTVAEELPNWLPWIWLRTHIKHFVMSCTGQSIWRIPLLLCSKKLRNKKLPAYLMLICAWLIWWISLAKSSFICRIKYHFKSNCLFLLIWEWVIILLAFVQKGVDNRNLPFSQPSILYPHLFPVTTKLKMPILRVSIPAGYCS